MTATQTRPVIKSGGRIDDVDLQRWPAMQRPEPAPVRAAAARALFRRVAARTGLRVLLPDGPASGSKAGPTTAPTLRVRDAHAFFTRLGRDAKVGFGEAYMAGDWDADDLVGVLEPMARNVSSLVPSRLQWLRRFVDARHPTREDNDRRGACDNIARHYDLSNDLFCLFLDESMTYSSALFAAPDEPLETAQARKIERLLDRTEVGRGSRVLEIGTGWGELAIRAARRGAQVTSLTLSKEQATLARRRITRAGMQDAVEVRVQDYRDVEGEYDAVVSVEMIEAVGERWWSTYFRAIDARLAPAGRAGIQAILMPHDRLQASKSSWTWIHKYVFPGGLIPSERAIEETVERDTTLRVTGRLHFGASYAETLRRWRERFVAQRERVADLGFDATFRRMWTFYLAYGEAGFRARYLDVAQFVLQRPAVPPRG
jgi:cyclopropane-fatty-acyl-phospholipid synthase